MNIDRVLEKIENIPAFPATVQRIWQVISDQDYSAADLVAIIEYDQAITANILRMCNSAYFGVRNEVSNLRNAVVFLGRDNIVRTVNAAGVSRFYKDVKGYDMAATALWEHSVGVALMSRILAKEIFNRDDSTLFTIGLLHDIGKIILGAFVFESFQKIVDLVAHEHYSFLEAEEAVIGINHATVGGRMAASWNFPEDIINAITYHHRPDLMTEGDTVDSWLIYLADQACMMMGIGGGTDGLAYRGLAQVMGKFNISQKEFERYIVRLFDDLDNARELVTLVKSTKV